MCLALFYDKIYMGLRPQHILMILEVADHRINTVSDTIHVSVSMQYSLSLEHYSGKTKCKIEPSNLSSQGLFIQVIYLIKLCST